MQQRRECSTREAAQAACTHSPYYLHLPHLPLSQDMSEAMLEYLLDSHGIDVLDGPVDGLDAGELGEGTVGRRCTVAWATASHFTFLLPPYIFSRCHSRLRGRPRRRQVDGAGPQAQADGRGGGARQRRLRQLAARLPV